MGTATSMLLIRAHKGRKRWHLVQPHVTRIPWAAGSVDMELPTLACGSVCGTPKLEAGDDALMCRRCARAADPTKPRFGQMALRRA